MLKNNYYFLILLAIWSCTQPVSMRWPAQSNITKPWTRWWWMGSAVDSNNLTRQLEAFAAAGIGGVEISPIYGVKGYEHRFLTHLSAEWNNALQYTVQEAERLGLGVDMIQGTGWPFGGPQIGKEHAASRLVVESYKIPERFDPTVGRPVFDPSKESLEALLAFAADGEMTDLTSQVDSNGNFQYASSLSGSHLYRIFSTQTGQKVKRAGPGGVGWVMDHFSTSALEALVAPYENAFSGLTSRPRALFNDSYEVYQADWTPGFLDIFRARRGYDLRPWIPALFSGSQSDTLALVRMDYRQTIGELLIERFGQPWTEWANQNGFKTRLQAHGAPANLLDFYATADIPECESFNSTSFDIPGLRRDSADIRFADPDPVMLKFASSAAHVMDKPLCSAESLTWLADHFRVALSQCKPEIEQLFLSGVNHVFFHGSTYSPAAAAWPGWKFYASVNFAPSQPQWPDYAAFFRYIDHCQSILQAGQPDNELLLYWPVYDTWKDTAFHRPLMPLTIHDISEWLHPTAFYRLANQLMKNGYSIDFISDQQLEGASVKNGLIQLPGAVYRAVVIPPVELMPPSSLEQLVHLSESGGKVIMAKLPNSVPGWSNRKANLQQLEDVKARLKYDPTTTVHSMGSGQLWVRSNILEALSMAGIKGEPMRHLGLKFIRRKLTDGHYYYVVNHSAAPVDTLVALNQVFQSAFLLNPLNGAMGVAALPGGRVSLRLEPGESIFIRTLTDRQLSGPAWPYYDIAGSPVELPGPWEVVFLEGGPRKPPSQWVDRLDSWTAWNEQAAYFSGTARYRIEFSKPDMVADDWLLTLGDVRESARIRLNGVVLDTCWSIPFQTRIGTHLKEEGNLLEIEVSNLAANHIRFLDQQGHEWKRFYDINIVHISYQPFDASGWEPMPSGLLGPVQLVPLRLK